MSQEIPNVWIALAEVESTDSQTGLPVGERAFVNALVPACHRGLVRAQVQEMLESIGFRLLSIESAEKWSKRFQSRIPDNSLSDLALEAQKTSTVQFGSFHTWERQG